MEKSKILLIDMYGVIIKESKGYFVPYTLQRFDVSVHSRIIRMIREEQTFTKAQRGELSSVEFLTYLGYEDPKETMEDYLEWSEFLMDYHKINPYFREKIVSGGVHMRKPDKEMFIYAIERLGCNPEQCIFVDNSVNNLLAAEELGIQTILYNRDGVEYGGKAANNFEELGKILEAM